MPAKARKPRGGKPAATPGSYRHETATRAKQPTIETAPLMDKETRQPQPFTVEPAPHPLVPAGEAATDRQHEPQPRLAWDRQGRTSTDDDPSGFAGAPLYTREKVNPLTMIEQLRKPGAVVAPNLFDDFNGFPADAESWDFYQHSGHWQNRLIHGDSSAVMQSLIARDGLAGRVQMIYFDPPYGIGFKSNFMTATDKLETNTNRTGIPVGDTKPVKAFKDTYRNGIHSYLDEIHERLALFRELLADTGSLFVQIGDDNVHRLALILDEVFGHDNRVATITWRPTGGSSAKTLPESASYLLWYAKDKPLVKYRQMYEPLTRREIVEEWSKSFSTPKVEMPDGTARPLKPAESADPDKHLPSGARLFHDMPLTSQGASSSGRTCTYEHNGVTYYCGDTRQWRVSTPTEQTHATGQVPRAIGVASPPDGSEAETCGMDRLAQLGRLYGSDKGGDLRWKWYEDEVPGRRVDNVWHQVLKTSNKRYVVQVANAALERCILMSTDPGDLVLDPTLGSGVTAHMSERWGRRWIGIDVSRVSVAIARRHLLTAVHPWYKTLDGGADPSAGFDVEAIQRVSAATLAYDTVNDPENTIRLVDRPREDRTRKRLTGPFTVESSSPFTYLPFSDDASKPEELAAASGEDAERLLDAFVSYTICDSDGQAVLEVDDITAWPDGQLVTHEADCAVPGRQTRLTAAVMFAAPDATVAATQIVAAVTEARNASSDTEHLIVVASAFDDNAPHRAGPVQVHKVVTARDLQIGALDDEPDTGALTLLGEPDVDCATQPDGTLVVTLNGYDTYNPATGGIKASMGDDLDCWMIDTDHDRLAFFPRLVYLPAYKSGDPNIRNLVKALGKDLDPAAEKALCGLVSQPFKPPSAGNTVAVKIITRTGAEMTATIG